jgi:hypothetical protein
MVPVTTTLWATANHCPSEGHVVWRSEEADLKLIRGQNLKPWPLLLEPVPAGSKAILRGREMTVLDGLRLSDGHFFALTSERTEYSDSGFALHLGGGLIGVTIGRQNAPRELGVFVHAAEIARAIREVEADDAKFESMLAGAGR